MREEIDSNDRTTQWFGFIEYIDKYKTEDIVFTNSIDKSYVITKEIAEGNIGIPPMEIGARHLNWVVNKNIGSEMVERFCLRLWKDHKQAKTEIRFIEEQIEYLERLNDWIKEEYYYQYWPILKYFEEARINQGFKKIDALQQTKTKPTKEKIAAPIIGLFCMLINETKIIERLDYESVATYCKKVCDHFDLTYTVRVRQNFNGSETKRNIEKVKKLILPNIDKEPNKILIEYFAKNNK